MAKFPGFRAVMRQWAVGSIASVFPTGLLPTAFIYSTPALRYRGPPSVSGVHAAPEHLLDQADGTACTPNASARRGLSQTMCS